MKNTVSVEVLKQFLIQFQEPINRSLKTERTRLSKAACEFLEAVVRRMGSEYQKMAELFVGSLMQQCGCSNKVAYVAADACMITIIQCARVPRLISKFVEWIRVKRDSDQIREFAMEYLLQILEKSDAKTLEKYIEELESVFKLSVCDRSFRVRTTCKSCFYHYSHLWPDRVPRLVNKNKKHSL
jgi:hypothetical protein